jgi:hypothetical protein
MAFTASDLYLASGTATLYNSWTPTVTKFDSSSFYNWEQDNEPLYDLDERTHYLWEKLGYPIANGFSGIPGMMLAVSADAPFAGESSGLIYKSVSAAINALPEVIAHPVIIEVASFGELGTLNLNGLKFKDNGGLEIVNRNFTKVYGKSPDGNKTTLSGINPSSIDSFNTLRDTSCLALSARVCSSTNVSGEVRWSRQNHIMYYNRAHNYTDINLTTGPASSILSVHTNSTTSIFDSTTNVFSPVVYDSTKDLTISSADFLSYNELAGSYMTGTTTNAETNGRVNINVGTVSSYPITGYFYGNWFTEVKIENCAGPIYIRNFAVDGASGEATTLSHNTVNGYYINNSKLVLENSLAIRCKEAGFKFVDSDVIINRGIVAMRNYTLNSYNSRSSFKSAGIRCVNSNVTLSTSPYVSGVEEIVDSTKNYYGIDLINSNWIGGKGRATVSTSGVNFLHTFHNNVGLRAENSYLEIPGRLDTHTNDVGAWLCNSKMDINEGTFDYNQSYGLKCENSIVNYNPDLTKFTKTYDLEGLGHFSFNRNGVNLHLDNSKLLYTDAVSIPSKYGAFYVKYSTGVNNQNGTSISLPAIELINGSIAKFVNPYITNYQTGLAASLPVYGTLVSVKDNSKAVFAGSKDAINFLQGPPNYNQQLYLTNVYAKNHSTVEFQGPTIIFNAGVDVLAEDNSVINFAPHRDDYGNILATAFDLSARQNHTLVELHSTRACLVANKNSVINMENLGDFNAFWPASQTSSVDYNQSNGFYLQAYTSGGYMQFYPNGQESTTLALSAGRIDVTAEYTGLTNTITNPYILVDWSNATSNQNILKYSTGGMCVRAIDNSIVNVKNVHFPCGWENTSSVLYDSTGGNCDLLRIWNIGPGSHLNANFCTVSGVYPSLAGYTGPSAVYLSGSVPASAAPSTTPDTGVLSVLDFYGASGAQAAANYGPFRIMVSVDGAAKFLSYYNSSAIIYNAAYQTWAQGYNPSGSVSAAPEASSVYKTIGSASAFLTTSAMIDSSYRNRIRLDESAANIFANAKNGSIARSGRVPFCTIYRSRTTEGSEGYDTSAAGYGLGLLSVNIFDLSRIN